MKTVHISEVKSKYVETKLKGDHRYVRTLKEDLTKDFKELNICGKGLFKSITRFPERNDLKTRISIDLIEKEVFEGIKIRATVLNKDEYPYCYDEQVKVTL